MNLSPELARNIIEIASSYISRPFDYEQFNCVHFVREVYSKVDIELPLLVRGEYPPQEFHLSINEFEMMPIGHCVFFKRRTSVTERVWTHVAMVYSSSELIHCARRFGGKVVVTPKAEFLDVYILTPQSPC